MNLFKKRKLDPVKCCAECTRYHRSASKRPCNKCRCLGKGDKSYWKEKKAVKPE